jgi:hypothetical protein
MKRPFRFNKLMAVLTSSGLLLLVLAATGLANSSSVSVTPCDPSVSTCVDVFQPVIRNIEKRTGPSVIDGTNSFHTLITMTNIPNGFYKVEANGVLDYPDEGTPVTEPTSSVTLDADYKCQLVLVTADNGQGSVVDGWEQEATQLTDATFFLKAAINMNSSNGVGSMRVDCTSNITIFNSEWLKIIAVDASNLISQSGF